MRIQEALLEAGKKVPQLDAEVLLAYVLGKSKEHLFIHSKDTLSPTQLENFNRLLAARIQGEPIAYLIGIREFFGLDFYVDENVLIPRPETELLVEEVLKLKPESILDVGTGSGCVAIAVKQNLLNCRVVACDNSPAALQTARRNAKHYQAEIEFLESDLLENISGDFEVIVANLPYIPVDSSEVQESVKKYEPHAALFAGEDGLDLIRKLLTQVAQLKQKPKFLLLEIGLGQADLVEGQARKVLQGSQTKRIKDLAGIERIMKIQLK
jgi:release factor glutamine methyltransferase